MDLHQLKTFVAVAREGSITRASGLLHLSQPAVSAHIKAMEDTLGLSLFERTPRGMSLTPDGQRLLAKAEQTLAAHQELMAEATRTKGELTFVKLRISVFFVGFQVGFFHFPELAGDFFNGGFLLAVKIGITHGKLAGNIPHFFALDKAHFQNVVQHPIIIL